MLSTAPLVILDNLINIKLSGSALVVIILFVNSDTICLQGVPDGLTDKVSVPVTYGVVANGNVPPDT